MKPTSKSLLRGFTFIELMVSVALGLLVVAAAVKLFSQGVDATWVVSQRAEMQQDLRAVENMLVKDISLAGAGLPSGQGVPLASGTGKSPIYGCDQSGNCPPNGAVDYPCAAGSSPCIRTLYGVMPGYALGIIPPGGTTKTDLITVAYSDVVFQLDCYNATITSGTSVTFTLQSPLSCTLPPGLASPQAVNDPVVGLTQGDVILFQGTTGSGTSANTFYAVGEVTNVGSGSGTPPSYVVTFGSSDPLQMNQPGATNDLSQYDTGATNVVANRIFVISYYVMNLADPTGVTAGTPVLMRQVSGHTAVPATENIVNMQYTYDTYNTSGTLLNATGDGGESAGVSLNLIRKINIAHLTIRSQLSGSRSNLYATNGYQGFDVQTSISARNLSYQNRY
jgi:prepilin-type N-terminal cleavage/methylation domain-containing protein